MLGQVGLGAGLIGFNDPDQDSADVGHKPDGEEERDDQQQDLEEDAENATSRSCATRTG